MLGTIPYWSWLYDRPVGSPSLMTRWVIATLVFCQLAGAATYRWDWNRLQTCSIDTFMPTRATRAR